jgi:hypothetical protein
MREKQAMQIQAQSNRTRHGAGATVLAQAKEPVGLWNRRLRMCRSGPFFTVFLPHSTTMGRRIRQKLVSLVRLLAFDAQGPTGS